MCKRPLIKRCDSQDKYGAPRQNEPKIVCETFFETACNTTDVVPAPGDEPLPVTFCDKIPRKFVLQIIVELLRVMWLCNS